MLVYKTDAVEHTDLLKRETNSSSAQEKDCISLNLLGSNTETYILGSPVLGSLVMFLGQL